MFAFVDFPWEWGRETTHLSHPKASSLGAYFLLVQQRYATVQNNMTLLPIRKSGLINKTKIFPLINHFSNFI